LMSQRANFGLGMRIWKMSGVARLISNSSRRPGPSTA
jgi:hypothetical protein